MTVHKENKFLPFKPEQLYAIVSDIESYPIFLPWVSKAIIDKNRTFQEKAKITLEAEIFVKFNLVRENFRSKVTLDSEANRISTTNIDGPFKRLNNEWIFKSDQQGCKVIFEVDFEFKSFILHSLINSMFHKAMTKVTLSFEKRAKELYW